ncbi:MAG: winged helix-turn-helix domain-containing protein [Acidobacteriota bacterium]
MGKQIKRFYEFGDFRIDSVNRRLLRDGEVVALKAKAVETLLILLEHRGDVVEKDDLMNRLWANNFVEEANLTQNIYTLRKALGGEYIETIPRRGYRFTAEVKEWEDGFSDELILVREKTKMNVSYKEEVDDTPEEREQPTAAEKPITESLSQRLKPQWLTVGLIIIATALAALFFFWMRPAKIAFEKVNLAKLTTTGNVWKVAVSPDGKYLAFVVNQANQQSLWLRQLGTGKDLQLTSPTQTQFYGLTFTHDGNYLYYTSRGKNRPGTLYRLAALGGEPLKISEGVDSPPALAPDDAHIAFLRFSAQDRALIVANADGTQEKKLAASPQADTSIQPDSFVLAPEWDVPPPAWSPDGKTIACTVGIPASDGRYETIWGFDTDSGASRPLTSERFEEVGRPEWLSDGSGLIAAAAKQGTGFVYQIWHIDFPSGAARKITNDLNDYRDMSVTRDGKTVIAVQAERKANINIASMDDLNSVRQITFSNYDGINGLSWTPDDKIVFTRLAPGEQNLWITDLDGSEPRALTTHQGFIIQPVGSPDGRYVVFASNRAGRAHIWRIDVDGRNPLELTGGFEDIQPSITPDGQQVVFKSSSAQLFRVGIGGGEAERIFGNLPDSLLTYPTVSPNGKALAFYYRANSTAPIKWAVMPIGGGEPRVIGDLPTMGARYAWTPDGQGLAFAPLQNPAGNIWIQPLDGSPPKQLTFWKPERIFSFGWSKDGKKLAFATGTQSSDVVSISDAQD